MLKSITRVLKNEKGISSVEYAILLAFIAAGVITAATLLGPTVASKFTEANTALSGDGGDGGDGGGATE